MNSDIPSRVAASLALLDDYLASLTAAAPTSSRLLDHVYRGVSTYASGGKHLRAHLVHISAGEVRGARLRAATVFGASVDMLHGAFLIHDDVIDRDDTRRGHPSVHAAVREEFGDAHLGTSLAITAGDLGLTGAVGILLDSDLEDTLVRGALRILNGASQWTIVGEILDIAHSAVPGPAPDLIRLSNDLKTSVYSFGHPCSWVRWRPGVTRRRWSRSPVNWDAPTRRRTTSPARWGRAGRPGSWRAVTCCTGGPPS